MTTGLPHSEISGSTVVCTYPELIAACHVLLRHQMPRHPPLALNSLTQNFLRRYYCKTNSIKDQKIYSLLHGDERARTADFLLAKQALSQLSYTPEDIWWAREDLNLRPHDYQSCALAS